MLDNLIHFFIGRERYFLILLGYTISSKYISRKFFGKHPNSRFLDKSLKTK